ncbi:MAG: hypothetical protein MEEGG_00940 [Eggerthella lenta]
MRQANAISEREVSQLETIAPEHDNQHVRIQHSQNQSDNKAQVPITPNPYDITAFMGNSFETGNRMYGDANQFSECGDIRIDAQRQSN